MDIPMDKWLGPLIKKTSRSMTNLHDQKLAKFGLTASQVGVLSQLWKKDGQSQKQLLEHLGIRPASLTGIVDGMVRRGWVFRKSVDQDARIKRVLLTQEGKRLEELCLSVVLEMEQTLRQGFKEEELTQFISLLKRIHSNVEPNG